MFTSHITYLIMLAHVYLYLWRTILICWCCSLRIPNRLDWLVMLYIWAMRAAWAVAVLISMSMDIYHFSLTCNLSRICYRHSFYKSCSICYTGNEAIQSLHSLSPLDCIQIQKDAHTVLEEFAMYQLHSQDQNNRGQVALCINHRPHHNDCNTSYYLSSSRCAEFLHLSHWVCRQNSRWHCFVVTDS